MKRDLLARGLLDLAGSRDRRAFLVILAGAPATACLCFSRDPASGGRFLRWEASARQPGSLRALQPEQQGWLRRLRFDHSAADGRFRLRVILPRDLDAARLIADLGAFVLEHAYSIPADAPVTVRLREVGTWRRAPSAA